MATVYSEASDAVEKLVLSIRDEHHKSLRDADILVIAANKQPKDRPCRLVTAAPGEQASGHHLRFQYDEEVFENSTPAVQAALIDNALADIKGVERRSRDGEDPRMVYQACKAIRIHPSVIQRRGPILEDWGVAESAFKQMSLAFDAPRRRKRPEDEALEEPQAAAGE